MENSDEKIIEKWKKRFKTADTFRQPYIDKNLRMYKLYRGYRDVSNYAYNTRIMPPTAFEIIETIKPRLTASKMKVKINPTKAEDLKNKAIDSWDDLVNYNFKEMMFQDLKIQWIDAMLKYGNGTLQIFWDGDEGGQVGAEVTDNWLLYVDPNAKERFRDARYIIKRIFKTKQDILDEEKERGEDYRLYDEEKLKEVEDKKITDDPRRDRYQINTLKMGQVDTGARNSDEYDQDSSTPDKQNDTKQVDLYECWDLKKGTITTIANWEQVLRNEDSAYANVNKGNVFIDLPDIQLGWEYYAMGHLEPVETTIHELADGRNQAMDDIIYSLDPIRKIRKGAGISADDIKHAPGAVWELANKDDVVIERPPEVSRMWVEKDKMLRQEIQTSLALSEYTQGSPSSSQEPMGKVDLLLMQSNIRFSLIVRQMEISFTQLANAIIEMNREFLGKDKLMRIVGDEVTFKEFKTSDKNVIVDADVKVEPVREKTPAQRANEILELYKIFVAEDQPKDENEIQEWKRIKREFKKMILHEFDKSEYEHLLLPKLEATEASKKQTVGTTEAPQIKQKIEVTPTQEEPIPMLKPEPLATKPAGLLQKLQGLINR